jgi:HAD superfamily hydrolase (TIGR01509 family)
MRDSCGVLFDVDGTLVDTTYLHALCWHDALRAADHIVPMAVLHRAIGMGSEQLLDHVLGEHRNRDEDDAISTAHKTLYRVHWERLVALPRASELVRACSEAGLRVVFASSADEHELDALQAALDVDDAVDTTTNADDVERTKPAPDILQVALDKAGLSPSDVVFVGDAVWDCIAANKLDIPFVGLTCGGTSEAELREAGAAEVWRDPGDLLDNLGERLATWFPDRR